MGARVRITYIGRHTGREVGHFAWIRNIEHLEEILERYGITPEKLLTAAVDGQQIDPVLLPAIIKQS